MGITRCPASRKARRALLPNLCRSREAPTTATTCGMPHYGAPGRERASLQWLAVRRPVLSLLLFSFLTFGIGLGRQAITEADEAYYAEASREMVVSGDWLTPHFNYE